MIVYFATKARFHEDILSNRIEEIVHDAFKGALGKSVGPSELAFWKNSLRHMDTVLDDVSTAFVRSWIPFGDFLLQTIRSSASKVGAPGK